MSGSSASSSSSHNVPDFYVAFDGEFMGAAGEMIRSACAMGCKAILVVNLRKKKVSTFGGKGAELYIPQWRYSSWEALRADMPHCTLVGLTGRERGDEVKKAEGGGGVGRDDREGETDESSRVSLVRSFESVSIEEMAGALACKSTIFVVACGKRYGGETSFLTDAQVTACDTFVHTSFPCAAPLERHVRYVVMASICLHRFATLRAMQLQAGAGKEVGAVSADEGRGSTATDPGIVMSAFRSEKFVLGDKIERGARVVHK